jgi:hypothetical protein
VFCLRDIRKLTAIEVLCQYVEKIHSYIHGHQRRSWLAVAPRWLVCYPARLRVRHQLIQEPPCGAWPAIVLWRRGSSSMLRELQHGRRWRVPMHSDEETRELRDDMRFFLQARRFYLCACVACMIPKTCLGEMRLNSRQATALY